jgi:hypothetical protein
MKSKIEEMRADIERKRLELELMEKSLVSNERALAIKDLSEFTDEEKIKVFDKIYKSALSIVEDAETNGYVNDDNRHYIYEDVMSVIARDSRVFWKYFNSLT